MHNLKMSVFSIEGIELKHPINASTFLRLKEAGIPAKDREERLDNSPQINSILIYCSVFQYEYLNMACLNCRWKTSEEREQILGTMSEAEKKRRRYV